jgi:hypothetical protein
VEDLQAVVAGVGDPLDPDHLLHVVDAPAADDGYEDTVNVGESLQNFLRLGWYCGEVRV